MMKEGDYYVSTNRERATRVPNLEAQAIMEEMRRLFRTKLTTFRERMNTMQESNQTEVVQHGQLQNTAGRRQRDRPQQESVEQEVDYNRGSCASNQSHMGLRREKDARRQNEDNLSGSKIKVPVFHGKDDPDAYLEWEKKMKHVFDGQLYSEQKKVRVAAYAFRDYASKWWDQVVTSRRRYREPCVDTWKEMKNLMRKRFIPSHYHMVLQQKLRKLIQGNDSVEDYFQEMETLMIKADINEDQEATMTRFLRGLSPEIQDEMELQNYQDLEELLHKAIFIEKQVKRRSDSRPSYGTTSTKDNTSHYKDDKAFVDRETESKPHIKNQDVKGKDVETTTKPRDVRCFKCQRKGHYSNECFKKKTMVPLENGEIEAEKKDGFVSSKTRGDCVTHAQEAQSGCLTQTPEPRSGSLTHTPEPRSGCLTHVPEPRSGSLTQVHEPISGCLTHEKEARSSGAAQTMKTNNNCLTQTRSTETRSSCAAQTSKTDNGCLT